jgi:hypothetical protein
MADTQIALSAEERDFLATLLQAALKETRIEEHRTKALSFREHIIHKEELLNAILAKIGGSSDTAKS